MNSCLQDMNGSPAQMAGFMYQQQPETPVTSRFDYNQFPQLDPSIPLDPNMMDMTNWTMMSNAMLYMQMQNTTYSLNSTPTTVSSGNDSGFLSTPEGSPEESEPVAKVQGRLNLNNNPRQYTVTKSEVRRRLEEPERMNSSTMAAYLRKAKVKGGGRVMRDDLIKQGINLPHQIKKKEHDLRPTCFSALLEEESIVMAKELNELAQQHFPKSEMVSSLINQAQAQGGIVNVQELAKEAVYADRFLRRLMSLSGSITVPLAKHNNFPLSQDPLYQQMYRFSNFTHGFGYLTHKTWISVFQQIAREMTVKMQQNGVSTLF